MQPTSRTQVAIVGAGPAGLLLAHLLHREGIDSVVLELRSREYIEQRVRAGVLEQATTDILTSSGVGERMQREGMLHHGIELAFDGARHQMDFASLTGRAITVYAQHEVVKDLVAARLSTGRPLLFEAGGVAVHGIDTAQPFVTFEHAGAKQRLDCDFIAGCDGFHGVCRPSIPSDKLAIYEHVYPFGWLGILAQAAPALDELVYAHHERGFALFSMRTKEITRLYLQCAPDEDAERWSDEAIWDELLRRFESAGDWRPNVGPILQKGVTGMRSFVAEPMRHGRLFLAGDAAHIVPPTGAKGLNLAAGDVWVLAHALAEHYRERSQALLDAYSTTCLARVWRAQRFSAWMTSLLHRFADHDAFQRRVQLAELRYVASSRAAASALAENYVGLPLSAIGSIASEQSAAAVRSDGQVFAKLAR
jgi:p-hydroxybenzoate 3-monooxygenase